ncbi:MAG: hypothetical protein RBU37_12775 [Myxococcota bacterium]|jgi:hypothetical protein|nr:hypothetical protein [Myxococcota bacterium]
MKKLHLAVAMPLPMLLFTGFDCRGPANQCDPPEGVLYLERYCNRGVRGSCGKDETQSTYWVAEPCLEGSVCTLREDGAVCLRPDGSEAPEPEDVRAIDKASWRPAGTCCGAVAAPVVVSATKTTAIRGVRSTTWVGRSAEATQASSRSPAHCALSCSSS